MHILLTDLLECPRCGSGFGLVLFADDLRDRRVFAGSLGCANCRETYPVRKGFADLRPSPRPEPEVPAAPARGDPEEATRIGAFLGVTEGPATVALFGAMAGHAPALADMVPDLEVVAVVPRDDGSAEREGVSRLAASTRLPFRDGSLSGVVLEGEPTPPRLEEAVRSVRPGSRLVVLRPGPGLASRLEARGVDLLVSAKSAVVGTV